MFAARQPGSLSAGVYTDRGAEGPTQKKLATAVTQAHQLVHTAPEWVIIITSGVLRRPQHPLSVSAAWGGQQQVGRPGQQRGACCGRPCWPHFLQQLLLQRSAGWWMRCQGSQIPRGELLQCHLHLLADQLRGFYYAASVAALPFCPAAQLLSQRRCCGIHWRDRLLSYQHQHHRQHCRRLPGAAAAGFPQLLQRPALLPAAAQAAPVAASAAVWHCW